jgi:hexosaminidase
MYERMFRLERQLDEQGLGHIATYERGLRQLASNGEYAELKALTDVLVPVRGYKNLFGRLANPTMLANSASPLNGIGDIISTDPEVKRTFRRDVAAWLEKRDATAADRIRRQLQAWSTVEENLKARTTGYRAYAAILPHAANLRRLSEAGLRAMDNISGGKAFSENELAELTSLIAASRKAHDHTELDIVPEIESLIRQKLIPEPRQYPLM